MKRLAMVAAAAAFLLTVPAWSSASAIRTAVPANGHVAVYDTSYGFGSDVISKLAASHGFSQVDTLGDGCPGAATPSLATLETYQAVLVYSDCPFPDPTGLSNVLADYVDQGGTVVLATFALNNNGFGFSDGRLVTGGYLPITLGDQTGGADLTLVPDAPGSPLLAGVNSFDGGSSSYHSASALAAGATLVAHWSGDGAPLVAYKAGPSAGMVVALNFYPPSSDIRSDFWNSSTDGVRLMTNALSFGAPAVPRASLACNGSYSGTYTSVRVANGAVCTLSPGATVLGNVTVKPGGTLNADSVTIDGSLNLGGSGSVCNSTIGKNVQAGGGAITIGGSDCSGNSIGGNVLVTGDSSPVTLWLDTIAGGVHVFRNSGAVDVESNSVTKGVSLEGNTGGVTVSDNESAALSVLGNSPSAQVTDNVATGNAICSRNMGLAGYGNDAGGRDTCNNVVP